jgi:lipoprotein-anchoring transpeptidase ErfK/SrfK
MRRGRAGSVLVAGALVAVAAPAALAAALALDRSGPTESGSASVQAREPAAPPEPAFAVPAPAPLRESAVSFWAPVRRPALARAAPSIGARVVARLGPRTPEGTANVVLVIGRRKSAGKLWVRVRLAVLPNGSTGWVERAALGGYGVVRARLVVQLGRLRATLFRDGRAVFRARVGIGTKEWPTPAGEFYVRNRLTRYDSLFYGPLAFGTSARSPVLTDWPDGGFIGVHGTDQPELLPGRVSHGCIRMRNEDILELGRLMPVGTPVTIR